jgi:hypothetical protein
MIELSKLILVTTGAIDELTMLAASAKMNMSSYQMH